jgi:hypothetical protein
MLSFSIELPQVREEELCLSAQDEECCPDELSPILAKLSMSRRSSFYQDLDKPLSLLHSRVVFEGELLRWKEPKKMVLRWCQLTHNGFKLYRNHFAAVTQAKPLFDVPHEIIANIRR